MERELPGKSCFASTLYKLIKSGSEVSQCALGLSAHVADILPVLRQVKISSSSQQMMTVKIMAEKEGRHDEFIGVVVVPVSRIMSGE